MAKQRISIRLAEKAAVNATIAEFLLKKPADSAELGRRARVLAALADLPIRRRKELEEAVGRVCQALTTQGATATVRFALAQRSGQRYVEVSVRDERAQTEQPAQPEAPAAAQPISGEETSLQRLGEMLDHFDISSWPAAGAVIRMAQALSPAFSAPSEAETKHWAEMLRTRSAEDALVLAVQHSRSVSLELGFAHDREALRKEFGDTTADENLAMLSLVASKSRNMISFMEPHGAISWINDAFVEATGYAPVEAIGKRPDELLFGPSTDEAAVRAYQQALNNGYDLKHDIMLYRRDGRTFWAECNLIPIPNDQGQLARWLSIDIDITHRRQTEESLLRAKEQAEASARLKSEFLANMSHEIRTPMNAIIGMTELALTTDLNAEQRDYLHTVRSSAESLLRLLNDVLDLSKIEARKLEIDDIDFNLAETIGDTLKALAVKAHQKGLELAAHVPMDLPQYVRGDPVRLKQMLFNLVGNAIKFTEQGEVVVDVESQWKTDDEIGLHFAVRDTGIGIPKEKLNQIFEAFTQADSATTRQFGGTGLGLTITSELVRLMQGKIWVESNVGQGTTFHIRLQLKLSQTPPETAAREEVSHLAGQTVLVVDDNATNRRILDEMLRHWNLVPTMVDSAPAAIAELEKTTRGDRPFDLVLLDAMLPGTDGFQLADQIRQREDLRCGTVMMLSSADRPHSAARCRELGIDGYLVKPVSAANLLDAILTARGAILATPAPVSTHTHQESPAFSAVGEQAGRPLQVLVVDDHEANRQLATRILTQRGHRCRGLNDGAEALLALEQDSFDVVLMDVQMPNMDGFEATREIRKRETETGQHLPIVALTAHAMKGDRERCLAAGMNAYLAKPLRPRELITLVESIVAAHRAGHLEALTVAHAADDGRPAAPPLPPFDFEAALESMDYDVELLVQQMQYLLNDGPALVSQIQAAIANQDARQLELCAHRLKGLLARYAARDATELAYELEQRGKNNLLHDAAELSARLTPLVDQLADAIQQYIRQHSAGP